MLAECWPYDPMSVLEELPDWPIHFWESSIHIVCNGLVLHDFTCSGCWDGFYLSGSSVMNLCRFGMILGVAYNTAGRVAVLFVSSGVVAVGVASSWQIVACTSPQLSMHQFAVRVHDANESTAEPCCTSCTASVSPW